MDASPTQEECAMQSRQLVLSVVSSAALFVAASVLAHGAGTEVVANGDLEWKDLGTGGVAAAVVSGDMDKGASRFFLRYPAGLVTPTHHHTSDHYVTVVSGRLALTVDGHEHELGPGSYFSLAGKASHVARVVGSEPAVMFIQADGAWDVVAE
jgi:quercetin dioxygenase-like cupin family protein